MRENPRTRDHRPDILITGIHRSGTTYVAHILSRAGLFLVSEPFNKHYGSQLIDTWKPYPGSRTASGGSYASIVDEVLTKRILYKSALQTSNPFYRALGRVTGLTRNSAKYNVRYLLDKVRPRRRIFKDPDLVLCSDYVQSKHGMKVFIMVRHPCAFYASLKRLGWRFDLGEILKQDVLVREHLEGYRRYRHATGWSFAEEAAILWLFIYTVVRDLTVANRELLLVRHEDLATRPLHVFRALFEAADLRFSDRIAARIARTTQAGKVEARNNRPQDFMRDSKRLADAWKSRLDDAEVAAVRTITEPVYSHFYGANFV